MAVPALWGGDTGAVMPLIAASVGLRAGCSGQDKMPATPLGVLAVMLSKLVTNSLSVSIAITSAMSSLPTSVVASLFMRFISSKSS